MFLLLRSPIVLTLLLVSALKFSTSGYVLEHCLREDRIFSSMNGIVIKFSSGVLSVVSDGHIFTTTEQQQFLESARAGKLYSIRVLLAHDEYIESSIPACQIVASRMKLKLTLSVNDVGIPIAIHLSTPKYDCPSDIPVDQVNLPDLSISLEIQKPKLGSSPETAKYLERLEKQREEMARAEQGDNRSFFAKYWTYIVPAVFLFILFSSMQDPNAAGGNTGGGNRQ
ncbi:unnamed protein product [Heterobilharzia americana]|nr:unnamed protein product [Heterobilharzia americana]